jgi:hypothetical protein
MKKPQAPINRDIPIPPIATNKMKQGYPFSKMEIGDSVFFEGVWRTHNARVAAFKHRSRHAGWDFTWRHESNGFRIWRTA